MFVDEDAVAALAGIEENARAIWVWLLLRVVCKTITDKAFAAASKPANG